MSIKNPSFKSKRSKALNKMQKDLCWSHLLDSLKNRKRWFDWMRWHRANRPYIQPGILFQSCTLHPCICTEVNYWEDHVGGISKISGEEHCCGFVHSSPKPINEDKAQALIEAFNREGELGLMIESGYDREWAEKFIKEWR